MYLWIKVVSAKLLKLQSLKAASVELVEELNEGAVGVVEILGQSNCDGAWLAVLKKES